MFLKEQWSNVITTNTFTDFDAHQSYTKGLCRILMDKLYYLENDAGKAAIDFDEDDWSEVLGSGCDGVQFTSTSGDNSYGHYYKYFSTAPNVSSILVTMVIPLIGGKQNEELNNLPVEE